MKIQTLTGRVERFASVYNQAGREHVLEDYRDDLRCLKKGIMTPEQIAKKWAAFCGLGVKKDE